jgi:hypothetical protein
VTINTLTNVTFNWDANPLATQTQLQYRISPGSGGGGLGTSVMGVGITTKTINGLTPNVNYQSRIRHNCGSLGIMSPWRYKPFATTVGVRMNMNDSKMRLFPNPVNDKLSVSLSGFETGETTLKISDITGQVVWEMTMEIDSENETVTFDNIRSLESGVYFLSAKNTNSQLTQKFIKIK